MKVLTEDDIRHFIREGKVYDKNILLLNDEMIITPSANSFLREHQIQIKVRENKAVETTSVTQLNLSERFKTLSDSIYLKQLNRALKKLHRDLYLPLISDEQLSVLEKKQLTLLQQDIKAFYQPLHLDAKDGLGELSKPKKGIFRLATVSERIKNASLEEIEIEIDEIKEAIVACYNQNMDQQVHFQMVFQQFEQWTKVNLDNLLRCATKGREN